MVHPAGGEVIIWIDLCNLCHLPDKQCVVTSKVKVGGAQILTRHYAYQVTRLKHNCGHCEDQEKSMSVKTVEEGNLHTACKGHWSETECGWCVRKCVQVHCQELK